MGRKPDLTPEEKQLRDLIRQAHEQTQALKDAIREARQLASALVADFEAVHKREIQLASNQLTADSNRISAQLNDTIRSCQKTIIEQIMAGQAVIDASDRTITIRFGNMAFNDRQPPPYPLAAPKENRQ